MQVSLHGISSSTAADGRGDNSRLAQGERYRCRSIGIVHAGEFTLLTIAGALASNFRLAVKEGTREPKEVSRDHADVNRIRNDNFSLGAEFPVDKARRAQNLNRRPRLPTKPRRLH